MDFRRVEPIDSRPPKRTPVRTIDPDLFHVHEAGTRFVTAEHDRNRCMDLVGHSGQPATATVQQINWLRLTQSVRMERRLHNRVSG